MAIVTPPYTHTPFSLLQALKKKQLIAAGKLGKFGKILDSTPEDVRKEFEL